MCLCFSCLRLGIVLLDCWHITNGYSYYLLLLLLINEIQPKRNFQNTAFGPFNLIQWSTDIQGRSKNLTAPFLSWHGAQIGGIQVYPNTPIWASGLTAPLHGVVYKVWDLPCLSVQWFHLLFRVEWSLNMKKWIHIFLKISFNISIIYFPHAWKQSLSILCFTPPPPPKNYFHLYWLIPFEFHTAPVEDSRSI